MQIKYFNDTDTVLVIFTENAVAETRDLDENVVIDLDKNGDLVSMTIEHAQKKANIANFSFQQIPAQNAA